MNELSHRRPMEMLIVEDNPGDVRLLMEVLTDGNIKTQVTVARDGEEALALLSRVGKHSLAPRPDLIVLDLNLPRWDGRELLREIKSSPTLRSIPVVVLTSSNAEKDVLRAYDLQANCYILKPVGLDRFVEVVRAIETFWFGVAVLPSAE